MRSALRGDVALLGLSLLIAFGLWIELARVVYGLSTRRFYATIDEFFRFAVATPAGHGMLLWGSVIGGILAWGAYCLVVVSAPILLDRRFDFFTAIVTSVRCVVRNTAPMALWAAIIAALMALSIATGFLGLVITIPWLGLAAWRARQALVGRYQNKP